jgi:hypothetical protein
VSALRLTSIQDIKSLPGWIWFLVAVVVLLAYGIVAKVAYPSAKPDQFVRAAEMAGYVAYNYPGWRMSRYVAARLGDTAGAFAWMAWMAIAVFALIRMGV